MQLVQFVLICIHSIIPLVMTSCGYSQPYSWVLIGVAVLFFVLFSNFYREEYLKKKKNIKDNKSAVNGNGLASKKTE